MLYDVVLINSLLGPLAGALKRSVNYQTDYISNRLMLGREVMGPEVIIEVKSDILFAVKMPKQVIIIHFDKLEVCVA